MFYKLSWKTFIGMFFPMLSPITSVVKKETQLRRLKKPFDEFPNLDICNNSEFGIKAPDCFMRDILFSGVTWNTLPKRAGNISL